jgi:DNA-binding transcriptional LysR family regulator
MHTIDLISLRFFIYVCESGSLLKAGERASVSSSAISKRMAQLEEQLGTRLIMRKGYGVVPTTAGLTLLEHARTVSDQLARIEKDMRNFAAGAQGQVRLLASASAIAERLAADVVEFQEIPAHSRIHVDIEECMTPEIVRGVQQGHASLGIFWDAGAKGELQSRPYCQDDLCLVVPERHPLAHHTRVRFEDTLGYPHAGLPVNSATQMLMQRHAQQAGRTLVQRIVLSTFETAVRVVRTGAAICIAPREIAQPFADSYPIKLIELDEPWAHRQFVICYRNLLELTPAARLLVDFLGSKHEAHAKP